MAPPGRPVPASPNRSASRAKRAWTACQSVSCTIRSSGRSWTTHSSGGGRGTGPRRPEAHPLPARPREARADPIARQRPLELPDSGDDAEGVLAGRGGGVHVLRERHHRHAAAPEVRERRDELADAAGHPIEALDGDRVEGPMHRLRQESMEVGTVCPDAGRHIRVGVDELPPPLGDPLPDLRELVLQVLRGRCWCARTPRPGARRGSPRRWTRLPPPGLGSRAPSRIPNSA